MSAGTGTRRGLPDLLMIDELVRNVRVKQVRHAVHENPARPFPPQRLVKPFRMALNVCERPTMVRRKMNQPRPIALGIAVLATLAYLGASGNRVPGGIGPLDS